MRAAGLSDNKSKAFLDEVGHQDLGSLLILHQNIMRGADLVSLKAIQQCDADHSRWRGKSVSLRLCATSPFCASLDMHLFILFMPLLTNAEAGYFF